MVMFSAAGYKLGSQTVKDSIQNITDTQEFCVNIVSNALRNTMNITSQHFDESIDEFEQAGLEKGIPNIVKAPFVAASPAVLECTLYSLVPLPGNGQMIIGNVVGVHINDRYIENGQLDVTKYAPLARLGYMDYAAIDNVFSLDRPSDAE